MKRSLPSIFTAALLFAFVPAASQAEGFFGVKASAPLLVSASGGFYLGGPVDPGVSELRPVLEGELGLGGGKILAGMDTISTGFGYGIKGSIMRTWFESIGVDKDNTYLGIELEGSYDLTILALGIYRRVEGDGDGWAVSASVGFRF